MQKGGYIIISITDNDIYNKLQIAMKINKPILFYENIDVCYFIDTISGGEVTSEIIDDEEVFTYHDIIMKKGSKTFTITSANVVSSEGEIQLTPDNFYPLLENIKDTSGNLRFVEGEGTTETITGVTITYNKWSLSGTHLMIVLAGSINDAIVLANATIFENISVPNYILNKIQPLSSSGELIERKDFILYGAVDEQTTKIDVRKSSNKIVIRSFGALTLNEKRYFRIQFDLLIDNEEEE